MKRIIIATSIVSLVFIASTGVVYAQEPGASTIVDAATVLAPLAAAALGIERLLEMFWGIVESFFSLLGTHPILRMTAESKETAPTEEQEWEAGYKRFKTWVSPAIGIGLGLWVALKAELMMFALMGVGEIVNNVDMLITGLVIGSGSKFTHDVIGIFSETKKLVEEGASLIKTKKQNANTHTS